MYNFGKGLYIIVLQMEVDTEASTQGSCQESTTCRSPDERKGIEVNLYGACTGTFVQHDVDTVVFHSRV